MRKYFGWGLTILVGFSLAGCQSSGSQSADQSQSLLASQMESRMGQIQSLGGSYSDNKATNLLKMIDGSTILLKSTKISLNDDKYKDKSVELTGIIDRTTDGKEIMDVQNIDVLDQGQSIVLDVPNWVDYSSQDLGLGFKYRDDYKLQENPGNVTLKKDLTVPITPAQTDQVTTPSTSSASAVPSGVTPADNNSPQAEIDFETISGSKTLNDYLGIDINNNQDLLTKGYAKSKIGSGYYDALKSVTSTPMNVQYLLEHNGQVLKISFQISNPVQTENYTSEENYFYDVLASLKLGNGSTSSSSASNTVAAATGSSYSTEGTQVGPSDSAGYSKISVTSPKFSIVYPKTYYYGVKDGTFGFGSQPLENQAAEITLQIKTEDLTGATPQEINGKQVSQLKNGQTISYSYKTSSGKIYLLTGPASKDLILQKMIGSISE